MSGFRVGRARAQHTYPVPRGRSTTPLARNFGSGPKAQTNVGDTETPIPWSEIDSVQPWDAATTYALGDIVSSAGDTWISLQNGNLNNDPAGSPLFWATNTVIPITPSATGVIIISAVICVENVTANPEELLVQVLVNGVPLPIPIFEVTIPGVMSTEDAIPVLAEARGLPLGVRADVTIEVAGAVADELVLTLDSTTIEVREVPVATG